jgi:RHS repeat-associated protein
VIRPDTCEARVGCDQLFDYEWDEVGRLARARRFDFVGGCEFRLPTGLCILNPQPTDYAYPTLPPSNPDADVESAYDSRNQRVVRASSVYATETPTTTYTADIFSTLRLNDTTFGVDNSIDYDRSLETDQVSLVAGGVKLGRVVYSAGDPLTLSSTVDSGTHVFLELADHLGSTTTVIDQGTSELVERTTYSAFGRVESDYKPPRWSNFREPFKFTGKEDDITLGVTYFGARYYSPYLGAWISPDPLAIHGAGGDLNPYAYVHGRVMSAVDALGLCDGSLGPEQCPTPAGGSGSGGSSGGGSGPGSSAGGGTRGSDSSRGQVPSGPPPTPPQTPTNLEGPAVYAWPTQLWYPGASSAGGDVGPSQYAPRDLLMSHTQRYKPIDNTDAAVKAIGTVAPVVMAVASMGATMEVELVIDLATADAPVVLDLDTEEAANISREVDEAFASGQVRSGTMVRFTDEGGPLSGSGPKTGTGQIWYTDNVKVPGAGPNGELLNIRTHAPNPGAPPGSFSFSNYTTQINTNSGMYLLPDGTFKTLSAMTPEEIAGAHWPAGNMTP